jgi:hypothetical protein
VIGRSKLKGAITGPGAPRIDVRGRSGVIHRRHGFEAAAAFSVAWLLMWPWSITATVMALLLLILV